MPASLKRPKTAVVYEERRAFPVRKPKDLRLWFLDQLASLSADLFGDFAELRHSDGELWEVVHGEARRVRKGGRGCGIYTESVNALARRWKLSRGTMRGLLETPQQTFTWGLYSRIVHGMPINERGVLDAVLHHPPVLARRNEYEGSATKARAQLVEAHYGLKVDREDGPMASAFGRAARRFRDSSRAFGVPGYRLELAEMRAIDRLASFPRLRRLTPSEVERLVWVSLSAELEHIAAERRAYGRMYGNEDTLPERDNLSFMSADGAKGGRRRTFRNPNGRPRRHR